MMSLDKKNKEGMVIPVADIVLLPGMEYTLKLTKISEEELKNLDDDEQFSIALPLKQNFNQNQLKEEDFHRVGVSFHVNEVEKTEKGYQVKIKTLDRVEINELIIESGFIRVEFEVIPDTIDLNEKGQEEMIECIKKVTREVSERFKGSDQFMKMIEDQKELNALMAHLTQFMPLTNEEKYELIKIKSLKDRSLKFMDYILKQKEALKLQLEMAEKFTQKANKGYRESVLRDQLKAIQTELDEGKSESAKKDKTYIDKIEEAQMPAEIKIAALDELEKLERQSENSAEYNIVRNYLDLLVKLPWKKSEPKVINLGEARRILDEQHYGLDKVKDRILQHLAVMQLKKDKKGSILLLVGPPGTGKTSLGKSIAQALDRKYIRLSLGGIRDEAEIRGHRRTYIGAMPGRIIQSIKKAGEINPVIVLDEVDKLMTGYNGDPASALLEVLDPEQNNSFTDHYLDLPYDLSEVFFIATANSIGDIPRPLLDRMEIIQISSYTMNEKFHIGKNHLIPEILEEHGLNKEQLVIEDGALQKIISEYTMEAGVRGLKKQLATLARITSEKIVSHKGELPFTVTESELDDLLGRKVSSHDKAQKDNPPGVVTGLAWTSVGGEILFIEATDMLGSGQVILTGQLGDVMKESARISLSLLKSRLPMNSINFKERDLHIHVPSGSVPKDGPSAGITLFTALASLVTGIKVDPKLAMTGEITLRGAVLPIGGLKEKLIGAQRAGITKILIPKENLVDLKDVPEEVRSLLTIKTVETVEDVLRETLGISLPRIEHVFNPSISSEIKIKENQI
ncbi:endopeptidase La [Clostridium estertheticum]|uniref:Lon protease n=1 Tax=Clostridium estertheticum subsp. estertheticum TaxID=1552 RepID=A0A1J0GG70_9CLOT|nr:endopeptidase La [Clostridium estertheticum]APC40372.1 endopeptidase La [Clostridium estertheticum subsp. estertheticum]MBU3075561.1 endopeptidase La [Clostridium estertheticum]MBU3165609.1 endopeptidase La [Clostridium estertheticum]MBZ9617812.1 endopeptidase La [Clostridium estertheticum subsp. laramiense]WAG73479.1 endopeptidase La [Clostridium estertheticum]